MKAAGRKFFISYARGDRAKAVRLTKDLRAEGAETWRDEDNLQPGEQWDESIEAGIEACPEFLIILTRKSVRSKGVKRELNCALGQEHEKKLLPVLWQNCRRMHELRTVQEFDFRGSYKTGFAHLLNNPPPVLTWWERAWVRLCRLPWLRPFTAALGIFILLAVMAIGWWTLLPSRTSVRVTDSSPTAVVLHVRNDGGRSSRLLGGGYWVRFGELPIEDQELVLVDPATKSRVPGHEEVTVQLTAQGLVPKPRGDGTYVEKEELLRLMRGKRVMLESRVAESRGEQPVSAGFPADVIQSFIRKQYPDAVP